MSHLSGTTSLTLGTIELTQGEKHPEARGEATFAGKTIDVFAIGKAAEALSANQQGEITAICKIFGGSSKPTIKVEKVISALAPVLAIDQDIINNLKQVLTLKPKATKAQIIDAVATANALLEAS